MTALEQKLAGGSSALDSDVRFVFRGHRGDKTLLAVVGPANTTVAEIVELVRWGHAADEINRRHPGVTIQHIDLAIAHARHCPTEIDQAIEWLKAHRVDQDLATKNQNQNQT